MKKVNYIADGDRKWLDKLIDLVPLYLPCGSFLKYPPRRLGCVSSFHGQHVFDVWQLEAPGPQ
ncbi:MAG: hypothetical protein GX650_04575 [Clostridiales bacterium]|nr:hypothetical protein [Clostridiales bacterium]